MHVHYHDAVFIKSRDKASKWEEAFYHVSFVFGSKLHSFFRKGQESISQKTVTKPKTITKKENSFVNSTILSVFFFKLIVNRNKTEGEEVLNKQINALLFTVRKRILKKEIQ